MPLCQADDRRVVPSFVARSMGCLTLRVSRAFGVGLKSRVRQPYQQLDLISFLPSSLDYLVRPREHVGRNRQADLLGRFEIDDELDLHRLLDWQVSRLSAF